MAEVDDLLKRREVLDLLKERERLNNVKISYDKATKGEVAADVARSVGRGAGYAGEFFGDIYDIGRATVDDLLPESWGVEDRSAWDAINPFGPEDEGDRWRRENVAESGFGQFMGRETIKRGDNALLDGAKTFGEFIVPTLTGGPMGGLRQAARTVAVTGGGAALAGQAGRTIGDMFGEGAGAVGDLIGQFIGALGGGLAARKFMESLKGVLAKTTGMDPHKLTDDVAKRAVEAMMQQADDPVKAQKSFIEAIERGDKGTVADLTGDAGVYNVEALANKGSLAARERKVAQKERDAQVQERADEGFGGDTTYVSEYSRAQTPGNAANVLPLAIARQKSARDKINQTSNERITKATEEATADLYVSKGNSAAATASIDDAQRLNASTIDDTLNQTQVSAQSEKLANTYNLADDAVRAKKVQPLWDQVNSAADVPRGNLNALADDALNSLGSIQREHFASKFPAEYRALTDGVGTISVKNLQAIVSGINKQIRDDTTGKLGSLEKLAGNVSEVVSDYVDTLPIGPMFRGAREAEKKHQTRFNPPNVAKARRTDGRLFAATLEARLEKGAVAASEILQAKSPAIKRQFEEMMRSLANRADKEGTFPAFLAKHDELLQSFPDLRAALYRMNKANVDLDVVTGTAAAVVKTEQAVQEAIPGTLNKARGQITQQRQKDQKFITDRELGDFTRRPNTTLDKILSDEASPQRIRELLRDVGKTAQEKADFKRMIGIHFFESAARNADELLDPKIQEQFKRLRPALAQKGLMSSKELDIVAEALEMTKSTGLRKAAAEIRSDHLGRSGKLMASGFAALSMKVLPGNSLILAGAMRQFFKDWMLKNPDPNLVAALGAMMKNPKRFEDAIRNYNPQTERSVKNFMKAFMKDMANTVSGVPVPPIMVESGNDQRLRGAL